MSIFVLIRTGEVPGEAKPVCASDNPAVAAAALQLDPERVCGRVAELAVERKRQRLNAFGRPVRANPGGQSGSLCLNPRVQ